MPSYKIVRMYQRGNGNAVDIIDTGLTLEQAQEHCSDPEASSSTCTSAEGEAWTRSRGPWFDGYTEE